MRDFSIVVATDADQGIGYQGKLPWDLPQDMKYFKNLTTQTKDPNKKNAVVMGRKTWESIPEKFRPLPGRVNIVLSKNDELELPVNVIKAQSIDDAFNALDTPPLKDVVEEIFVIGGAQIYDESLKRKECRTLYITQILNTFQCDARFPSYNHDFERSQISSPCKDGDVTFYFTRYSRTNG